MKIACSGNMLGGRSPTYFAVALKLRSRFCQQWRGFWAIAFPFVLLSDRFTNGLVFEKAIAFP
jgi:hypothetical protein